CVQRVAHDVRARSTLRIRIRSPVRRCLSRVAIGPDQGHAMAIPGVGETRVGSELGCAAEAGIVGYLIRRTTVPLHLIDQGARVGVDRQASGHACQTESRHRSTPAQGKVYTGDFQSALVLKRNVDTLDSAIDRITLDQVTVAVRI